MKRSIKFFGLNFENFLFFQSLRVGKFFSKFFLKGSYLKDLNRILKDISSKGFVKINHYYSPEEIESLNKLVIKILELAGIQIKDPQIYQIAAQEEAQNVQQEKRQQQEVSCKP